MSDRCHICHYCAIAFETPQPLWLRRLYKTTFQTIKSEYLQLSFKSCELWQFSYRISTLLKSQQNCNFTLVAAVLISLANEKIRPSFVLTNRNKACPNAATATRKQTIATRTLATVLPQVLTNVTGLANQSPTTFVAIAVDAGISSTLARPLVFCELATDSNSLPAANRLSVCSQTAAAYSSFSNSFAFTFLLSRFGRASCTCRYC